MMLQNLMLQNRPAIFTVESLQSYA